MTWSILARDTEGRLGIAIASRFFAVGALCMHTKGGVGALCTQALLNPLYGPRGLALLAEGAGAADVVARLVGSDPGAAQRQLHVLPLRGEPAVHTGAECIDWRGQWQHDDVSIAGNMLAGPRVIEAAAEAWLASAGQALAERLIAAMVAAQAAGGDKRGRQAAALRIHGLEEYPELDLRVDDHAQPIAELARLYEKSLERFQPFIACLARHDNPAGELDRERIEAAIERFHARRRAHG